MFHLIQVPMLDGEIGMGTGGRSEKANCEETLARHPEGREAVIPAGYLFCYPFRWSIKELMKIVEEEEGQRGGCTRYF